MTSLATLVMFIPLEIQKNRKIPFLLSVLITENSFSEDDNKLQKTDGVLKILTLLRIIRTRM